MGSEMVMVDEIPFPCEITTSKALPLMGSGITDIEIHFLQIKHNAIGIYLDESIVEHLGDWKNKKGSELAGDDSFFDALVSGTSNISSTCKRQNLPFLLTLACLCLYHLRV
ncbi:probable chalcone--flavonone isomerase 3 [Asparagus officinalis]|uniref:probable chalcone--flavonone isomerase 3 n=1 Tax=Asparagus officinalis TaxID=4686 RepID=UPI00098E74C5|nr:probable chalcone--flavonone isomerase 3 [Asparagus officinalis]